MHIYESVLNAINLDRLVDAKALQEWITERVKKETFEVTEGLAEEKLKKL